MFRTPTSPLWLLALVLSGCARAVDQSPPLFGDPGSGGDTTIGTAGNESGGNGSATFAGAAGVAAGTGGVSHSGGAGGHPGSAPATSGAANAGGSPASAGSLGAGGLTTTGGGAGGAMSMGGSSSGGATGGTGGVGGVTGGTTVACDGPGEFTNTSTRRCYRYVSAPQLSWSAAAADCDSWGGSLAALSSAAELEFVKPRLSSWVWLGGTDAPTSGTTAGTFIWTDGEPFQYTNWSPGEPNGKDAGDYCLQMLVGGAWNDNGCSQPGQYVCEAGAQ